MPEKTTTEIEKAKKYYPLPKLAEMSRIPDMETYSAKWKESVENSEQFWADEAEKIDWFSPFEKVWVPPIKGKSDFVGQWFVGGKLNVTYSCLDRWVEQGYGNETALIWMGEDDTVKKYTYQSLLVEVNRAANALKSLGIKKGEVQLRTSIW